MSLSESASWKSGSPSPSESGGSPGVSPASSSSEVPSSSEWQTPAAGVPFEPCHFVDVSDTLESKLEAMVEEDVKNAIKAKLKSAR